MSHTISAEDAGLVLRSKYPRRRALLAMAVMAIVGLTIALVVLATTGNDRPDRGAAAHANRQAGSYYGGHCRRTAPAAWCSQP